MLKVRPQKLATSHSSQKKSILSTPQKLPSPLAKPDCYDVIAYEFIEVQSDEDVDAVAKETLRKAMESAEPGMAGERMTYGNQAGRSLLEVMKMLEGLAANNQTQIANLQAESANHQAQIANLQAERVDNQAQITNLQAQIVNLQTESADNQAEIADLQYRVKSLTKDAKGYHRIRHRFIDVYCRDVLGYVIDEGRGRIRQGNGAAHWGDAITDATLYTTKERHDEDVLIDLYGLTANQITLLSDAGDYPSITVLNTGATWRAKGTANIPADVAAALNTFIIELIVNLDQGLTNQSLTGGTTALGRAYNAFWSAHRRRPREGE